MNIAREVRCVREWKIKNNGAGAEASQMETI